MSATPATRVLDNAGVPYAVRTYEHHADAHSYGEEAIQATGLDAEIVLKTLVVDVDGTLLFALVPVAARLDLKVCARQASGKRARLANIHDAERATGYVVGGISALGSRTPLPCLVDSSVEKRTQVVVSAGRRGMNIELPLSALLELTGGRLVRLH